MKIRCPNCGALMDEGEVCPECDHHDGYEFCECSYCNPYDPDYAEYDAGYVPDDEDSET